MEIFETMKVTNGKVKLSVTYLLVLSVIKAASFFIIKLFLNIIIIVILYIHDFPHKDNK